METHNDTCIKSCQSLLRGEISAIETYHQAIERFPDSPSRSTLEQIRSEHQSSASSLRAHLVEMGAMPETDSGLWGDFAKLVEGSATLLGEPAALKALQAGERSGVRDYENALEEPEVMPSIKAEIRSQLLPRLHSHIRELDGVPTT